MKTNIGSKKEKLEREVLKEFKEIEVIDEASATAYGLEVYELARPRLEYIQNLEAESWANKSSPVL